MGRVETGEKETGLQAQGATEVHGQEQEEEGAILPPLLMVAGEETPADSPPPAHSMGHTLTAQSVGQHYCLPLAGWVGQEEGTVQCSPQAIQGTHEGVSRKGVASRMEAALSWLPLHPPLLQTPGESASVTRSTSLTVSTLTWR